MNKPYCWLLNGEVWFKEPKETDKEFDGYEITPLYTHPVKELTDEEILDMSDSFCLDDGVSTLYEFTASGLIDFAKAILRKAQEK